MTPDTKLNPPTAQKEDADQSGRHDRGEWLRRAQQAFRSSTTYVDSNYRKSWEDSIRAFNNQHNNDSKYVQAAYDKRSKLFRPKTRSVIRKNEAAGAAAFFSSMDVLSCKPGDPSDRMQVAGADLMKQVLEYRLEKSIPWYQIVMGGLQDAQTVGVACAHVYWDYVPANAEEPESDYNKDEELSESGDSEYPAQHKLPKGAEAVEEDGQITQRPMGATGWEPEASGVDSPKEHALPPKVDMPAIDLFPVENLRIDPGSNWINPIESSPFVIHLIPMYAMDVREKMDSGEWHKLSDGMIAAAAESKGDSTRTIRNTGREDPYESGAKTLADYEIVWVQRHIHRNKGEDYEFYTLSDMAMLTDPRPLADIVFHGKRPYVMGGFILETHKIMPAGIPSLGKGLQEEANEIVNSRIDNVKLVLNKKWFAKRGRDVDVGALVRNVPGGVIMMEDPQTDVKESTWPDVTSSAYEEQGRIDGDMNDLLGNFSPAQVINDRGLNAPARNMAMLSQSAGTLVEYGLRTFTETFVQPILRQLVLLEQHYETDKVIIGLAGKRANLWQRFGINEATDDLLEREVTITVNVGMGATDPMMKLNKFLVGLNQMTQMMQKPTPGLNMQEVGKEIFGHLGYADGSRFFTNDNPEVAALQAQVQQMTQVIQQLQSQIKDKKTAHVVSLQKTRETNQTKVVTTQIQEDAANKRALATHFAAIMREGGNTNKGTDKASKKVGM